MKERKIQTLALDGTLKGALHHWWPRCISESWIDDSSDSKVGRLNLEYEISRLPAKLKIQAVQTFRVLFRINQNLVGMFQLLSEEKCQFKSYSSVGEKPFKCPRSRVADCNPCIRVFRTYPYSLFFEFKQSLFQRIG